MMNDDNNITHNGRGTGRKEMEQWKKKNPNFDENKPPTEEEIKMQLKLPPRVPQGEQVEFKEPLRQWEVFVLLLSL